MDFILQDPRSATNANLLSALDFAAGAPSVRCIAAFAFASKDGVDLLFDRPPIAEIAQNGSFDLIVGIDAVTTPRALLRLREYGERLPGLRPRVFREGGRLFHPKFAVFQRTDGDYSLVVGSGNLTSGGMCGNFEAFTIATLGDKPGREIWAGAERFLASCRTTDIDDEALRLAERNVGSLARLPDVEPDEVRDGRPCLVAEVPRNRWGQVDFPLAYMRSFFRVEPGSTDTIELRQAEPDGSLKAVETRRAIHSGPSHNYRIELSIQGGDEYPRDGRPIALFVRQRSGVFVYQVLRPHEDGYDAMNRLLDQEPAPANQVRRRLTVIDEVLEHWTWHGGR